MIVLLSDTHGRDDHRLSGPLLDAVREAELVVHAGDFTTPAVLDAFREEAAQFLAVHGNADAPTVRDRLPDARTIETVGLRIALIHRRDGGSTGLALFGRSRDADLVVSGHTHRPSVTDADDVVLLNPGSHADPRGNRPGYATLEPVNGAVEGRLLDLDGTVVERFTIEPSDSHPSP